MANSTNNKETKPLETPNETIKVEMRQLETAIKQHNRSYFQEASPTISDAEYDALFRRLKELEAKNPALAAKNSPTRSIGYISVAKDVHSQAHKTTYSHPVPMLSLANAMDEDELASFFKLLQKNFPTIPKGFCLTPKLDGAAVELIYKNGKFSLASTRGDGHTGEVITHNMGSVSGYPETLNFLSLCNLLRSNEDMAEKKPPIGSKLSKNFFNTEHNAVPLKPIKKEIAEELHAFFCGDNNTQEDSETNATEMIIRGEIVISLSNFQALNALRNIENSKKAVNPRNFVAGRLRLKNQASDVEMQFFAYALEFTQEKWQQTHPLSKESKQLLNSQTQQLLLLESLGFEIVRPIKNILQAQPPNTLASANHYCSTLLNHREQLNFEMDGVVIKLDAVDGQRYIGEAHRRPRWAVAWKFPADEKVSVLEDVEYQVGRTGRITPVALVKPVLLDGAMVSKATLHNEAMIKKFNLKLGDSILIERSGGVIPKIIAKASHQPVGIRKDVCFPTHCPACKSKLDNQLFDNTDGVVHFCPNDACQQRVLRTLIHFTSKAAMNIDGLGAGIVELLFEKKIVNCFADFFTLTPERLLQLDSFQEKKTNKILASLLASKKPSLAKFIYALGIPYIGFNTAKALAEQHKKIENFLNAEEEDVLNSTIFDSSITPMHKKVVYNYISNDHNKENIVKLLQAGVSPIYENLVNNSSSAIGLKGGKNIIQDESSLNDKKILFLGSTEENLIYLKEAVKKLHGKVIKTLQANSTKTTPNPNVQLARLNILKLANIVVLGEKYLRKWAEKREFSTNDTQLENETAESNPLQLSESVKPFPTIIFQKNWQNYFSSLEKTEHVFVCCPNELHETLHSNIKNTKATLCDAPLKSNELSKKVDCIALADDSTTIFVSEKQFRKKYLDIANQGNPNQQNLQEGSDKNFPNSKLLGKKILFTGKFLTPRSELQEKATAVGAVTVSSYTKSLDYLVVGEKPGSKLKKAKADEATSNVEIITIDIFLNMLNL